MVLAVALLVRLDHPRDSHGKTYYPKYFQSITKRLALFNNLVSDALQSFRNNRIVADISKIGSNETDIRHFSSLLPLPFPDILRRERTAASANTGSNNLPEESPHLAGSAPERRKRQSQRLNQERQSQRLNRR